MRASLPTISRASMGRSASISAPSRRRRSRFRSSAKSRPCCAWSGSRGARPRDDRGVMKFGEIPVADELGEDAAATALAHAVAGANVSIANAFTGRANLFAETRGLCVVDRNRLDEFNLVDEAATLATLAPYALVEKKQMVATIKIVPFGLPRATVERCSVIAMADGPLIRVASLTPTGAWLTQTRLPGLKESILDKTVEVTKGRLASLDSRLADERRCAHTVRDLAEEIRAAAQTDTGLLLIAGASAIVDRRDVIPA